ncbi:MAG: hypothetical protein C6P37_12875 [Caldibacillus debilis]|uniref:Uncharacterized protein n=1 Tax=Caldibacillus debilis TaxID=301148 RepID=A0A3E0K2V7_9BACI|nr:hypothetical protein [Bacillaceae bacterium]MBY6273049.1 hypothetical protein [Bacillaceae bacterium]REJ16581.1 MAG: hypothetical protein C6W57_08790 [Caldibacillus debilis]REJ22300.1 MAG: hypothetical protein C6W56_16475 [Caldibacillus debilis]REJ26954.1 MAG: hypothetical protein C6P37_12875 [Caldibacillus debilis]
MSVFSFKVLYKFMRKRRSYDSSGEPDGRRFLRAARQRRAVPIGCSAARTAFRFAGPDGFRFFAGGLRKPPAGLFRVHAKNTG